MKCEYVGYYKSPIGLIKITSDGDAIISCDFTNEKAEIENNDEIISQALKELDEYFKGKREKFDLKIRLYGTDFQKHVWSELLNIPYGNTVSYKDIAIKINNERAVRAVGNANNKNKIAIIVPCHRVIGKSGKLIGYAGGLDKKQWLLNHENKFYMTKL